MTSILIGISCHHLEDVNKAVRTVELWLPYGDVLVVFDRLPEWADRIRQMGVETIAIGPGVGRSRDLILRTAVELGYKYAVTSDCHILELELRQIGYGQPYEDLKWTKILSSIHPWENIDKRLFIYRAPYIPMSMAPVIAWDTRLVRRLMDEQGGYAILQPGFDYELFGPTLALATMGWWLRAFDQSRFVHYHRTGKEPDWVERWKEEEQLEMWHANRCIYVKQFGFPTDPGPCPQKYSHLYALAEDFYHRHGWKAVFVFRRLEEMRRRGEAVVDGPVINI